MFNDSLVELATCKNAKRGRRLVTSLLDYVITFVFSFSIYAFIIMPIFNALPATKGVEDRYLIEQEKVTDIIKDSRLEILKDDGLLVKPSIRSDSYLSLMIKTSLFVQDEKFTYIDSGRVVETVVTEEETLLNVGNDEIRYYFTEFRNNNASAYDKELENTYDNIEDVYLKLFKTEENKDLFIEVNREDIPYILSIDVCKDILSYMNYGQGKGETYSNRIKKLYIDAINIGIEELENHYTPYIEAFSSFKRIYNTYTTGMIVCLLISVIVAFAITYILFPAIFKRGKTISFKFFTLACLRNDLLDMRVSNYVIKDIVLFIEHLSLMFFQALLLGKLQILSTPLLGPINMFSISLFSLLVSIVSIVFMLFNKNHQTLSDYASLSYVVNTSTKEDALLSINEENEDGKRRKN